MTELARVNVELYSSLEAETGHATGFKRNGTLGVCRTRDRMHETMRTATIARSFGIEAEMIGPAEAKALYPAIDERLLEGAIFIPGDGQTNPVDTALSTRCGRQDARRPHLRGHARLAARAGGLGRLSGGDGARIDPVRDPGARLRAVDPRPRGPARRPRAALSVRAHVRGDRAARFRRARPPGAARHRRPQLRQGGCGQAPGRLLRARGQAAAPGEAARESAVRRAARGLGPVHAAHDQGHGDDPGAGDGGNRPIHERPRELHAGPAVRDRRGPGPAQLLRLRRLQLRRHRVRARRRTGAGRMDRRGRAHHGPLPRRHRPVPPIPGQPGVSARTGRRVPGYALQDALAAPAARGGAPGAQERAARALGGTKRVLRRSHGMGTAAVVRARGHGARVRLLVASGRTGSTTRPKNAGRHAPASSSSTRARSASTSSRGATPAASCSDSVPATWTCRRAGSCTRTC